MQRAADVSSQKNQFFMWLLRKGNHEMYEANRNYKSALYTNYMIYSPRVPVFRDDAGSLLKEPYFMDIITAPAVNAGVVHLVGR